MVEARIKSVAVIGAGAAGAITAAALVAEGCFDRVQVYERRDTAGGTWNYDPSPPDLELKPGKLPPDIDPPLEVPSELPRTLAPSQQERFIKTPVYESLTTNVPAVAMSFSDLPFAYGVFVPHHIPKQYIESYFATHKLDSLANLSLSTTLEHLSPLKYSRWSLTLRKHDPVQNLDTWWNEEFDAVVLANGHYSVPFVPEVQGLEEYIQKYPGKVSHSKSYRSPSVYKGKKVLVIGNSASGQDITTDLLPHAAHPIYQSRRSKSRWDGAHPPPSIIWKPVISSFSPDGTIKFADGTSLPSDGIDHIIYATGYLPSFPFWNAKKNGELWNYDKRKLEGIYAHTWFHKWETLAIVGMPRTLSFRGWEYQAVAIARILAGRGQLPEREKRLKWEKDREAEGRRKFHDIEWESGETVDWFELLYRIAGLGLLNGKGRHPPRLGDDIRWAIEHQRKYPEPDKDGDEEEGGDAWVDVSRKDLLHFL